MNKILTGIGLGIISFGCGFGGTAAFRLDDNTLASTVTMVVTSTIVFASLAVVVVPMAWVLRGYIESRNKGQEGGQQPHYPPVVFIGQQPQPYQVERNGYEPLPLPSGPREFTYIGDDDDE